MKISPDLSQKISIEIQKYIQENSDKLILDSDFTYGALASELHILPVLFDMGGYGAITPEGEVVVGLWDTLKQVTIETDQQLRKIILFRCSQIYPELTELEPVRPQNAIDCPMCAENELVWKLTQKNENLICGCGGTKWIFPHQQR